MVASKVVIDASAWIEIDAEAILYNLQTIKRYLKADTKILAVVKANAYGHGMLETARILQEAGVFGFGVTSIEEGIKLRQGGISTDILLFAPLVKAQMKKAIEYDLTPSIGGIEQLRWLQEEASDMGQEVKIHLKVETGMGRTGIWLSDVVNFIDALKETPNIRIEGVYSHLAKAGTDENYSEKQYHTFQEALNIFKQKRIDIPIKHIVNSAGAIKYPHMHLDMIRVGTLLFGQAPFGLDIKDIKDPWKAKAKVIDLRNVPANTPIGYGGDYVTGKDSKIGIVPIGFADGFNVSPRRRAKSLIDLLKIIIKEILAYKGKGPLALEVKFIDKKYPVVGRVGMQLSMVDFSGSNIKINDTVEFHLGRITAPYDLPRVYIKKDMPYKIIIGDKEYSLLEKGEI
jgi:alanine racemase